jgi:predicted component of type VI protein secretion system
MPRLVLLSEGFTGRTYELKTEKTTVGRVEDNAFHIPDGSVSSHHAEILLRGNEVIIKDLNSTNGTFINGERITELALKPGQTLRLGMVEMRLESPESGASATAAAAAAAKKKLDHTSIIPQGVKMNELEGPRTTGFEGKTGFEKKSNKGGMIFLIGVIVVGIALVVALVIVLGGGCK